MVEETVAFIDTSAILHNFQVVRSLAPRHAVMAMIKCNGYGHGALNCARTLIDSDAVGVSTLAEAMELREANIASRIILMSGFHNAEELLCLSQNQIEAVVHAVYQIELLENTTLSQPLKIWLKIDTGMNRLGIPLAQAKEVYQRLQKCHAVVKPIHLLTHLARADEVSHVATDNQVKHFSSIVGEWNEGARSIANSAAILGHPTTLAASDWVRPGIMLYGVSPFEGRTGQLEGLKVVMTLCSHLVAVHDLTKGEAVGYGATWTCPEAMRVGVVRVGYGDGYPRGLPSGTPILIGKKRVSLIGRVSMDMITVDLRNQPNAKVGDEVILWGENLPIEEIAGCAKVSPYELLCGVSSRVPRKIQ